MRILLAIVFARALLAQPQGSLPRSVTDPGIVTTRQTITPAGIPSVFETRVHGVAFGAKSSELWVLTAIKVYRLDWNENRIIGEWLLGGTPGLQGIRVDPATGAAIITRTVGGKVQLVRWTAEGPGAPVELTGRLGGAAAFTSSTAVVPLTNLNKVAIVDTSSGRTSFADTGIAPFGAVISADSTHAFVSNWGGRLPKDGDLTATAGGSPTADRVVVDARGIASTGSVTRIDLKTGAARQIATGLHPTALVLDEPRKLLYVTGTNSDVISVINTRTSSVIRQIDIQPFASKVKGIAPSALALSPAGETLYVACGGLNAVAVIDAATGNIRGLIPTAWYPSSLTLSADGKRLAVGSLLGVGSGWRTEPRRRFVHSYRGAASVIEIPDAAQLASYTTSVAENNWLPLASSARAARPLPRTGIKAVAVPERSGEPSLIEHVVFIVKENRTYDQVLGDLPKGNGDPSLVMFGRDVTPNTHRLAEQFVVLDNFYATGGNSADGHQWITQANETSYALWPGYTGRSYPFDGSDPIAPAAGGFLWDAALNRKKTVRIYGEYAGTGNSKGATRAQLLEEWRTGADFTSRFEQTAPIAAMNKILARNFPAYNLIIPDVARAQIFLRDLEGWNRSGAMPNLVMMLLPSDHTFGASSNQSTPAAMVADNDLALGQVVEALTTSKFWPKMAIFVVEDDAQDGVDHVDGHRTVALAVSPYTRRGHVDSTFYSHQSMVKTIELILGLPTLSLFDLIATDMRASFVNTPDLKPYEAVQPKQSLYDRNPVLRSLIGEPRRAALDSQRMRWNVPDAAPTARLNRILWHTVKGWNTPFPGTRKGVFTPLSIDIDDDDR